jgi:hypothetical protein
MLTGGCYCGKVRYEAAGEPFEQAVCHCSMCRRTTGAPMVAWFGIRAADFRFTAGEPRSFRSSAKVTRAFCPDCGAQLTFKVDGLDEIDITIASLDEPDAVPPLDEIWAADRVRWIDHIGDLPRYARSHREGLL